MANNISRIPEKELKEILNIVSDNYFYVISKWKEYFDAKQVNFYC